MRARLLTGITLVMLMLGSASMSAATAGPARVHAESAKVIVPNVVGMRMDRATRTLRNRGLRVNEECSGLFGCIIKSRWWVCEQDPAAGRKLSRYQVVVIYAERRGEC